MHLLSRLQVFAHAAPATWDTHSLFLYLADSYSFGKASAKVSSLGPRGFPSAGVAHAGSWG